MLVGGCVYGFFSADRNTAPRALEPMFGRSYEQLPADFRAEIDGRLRAVAPADWDQRTEEQRSAWATEQVDHGLVRLDDATLIRLVRLGTAVVARARVPVCAAFVRESGPVLSRATDEALDLGLSPKERMDRVEIHTEAVEAQVHRSPPPRTVSETDFNRVDLAIKRLLTPEEKTLYAAPGAASDPSDAELCAAQRAFTAATLRLPVDDLATLARWAYGRPYH